IHDVAPATADQTARWCADADSLGIPVSLLVIPGPWRGAPLVDEPGYADVLRARIARGDELVLHGWEHRAGPEGSALRKAVGRARCGRVRGGRRGPGGAAVGRGAGRAGEGGADRAGLHAAGLARLTGRQPRAPRCGIQVHHFAFRCTRSEHGTDAAWLRTFAP